MTHDDESRHDISVSTLVLGPEDSFLKRYFTPSRAVYLLTFVLFLNYMDRGIVSGGAVAIKGCVANIDLCGELRPIEHCPGMPFINDTCDQCRVCGDVCHDELVTQTGFGINSTKLGLVQSMFMVGYVIGAIFFGHVVNRYPPFKLICVGLILWCIACIGSGLSGITCDTSGGSHLCTPFYFLLFFRALSGIAEASLNSLCLPFLDDILDPETKGYYIGIYYTAIPCGTAFGFIWSGIISDLTGNHWEWAFILEAPLMFPFAILAYFIPFKFKVKENFVEGGNQVLEKITLWQNVWACISQPSYFFGVFGYAMYTGVVAGLGFYGPIFIQDYRPCDKRWGLGQAEADVLFGIVIGLSGLVGTLLGASFVDRIQTDEHGRKGKNALTWQLIWQLAIGLVICLIGIRMHDPKWFFAILFLGSSCMFMVSTGINLMLMWTVPRVNRAMANSLSVFIIHTFGDVPSPILIGYISDHQTPMFTLSITVSFMVLAIVFWLVVVFIPVNLKDDEIDFEVDEEEESALYTALET